jgi:D-alanyl-D-alanine carboxypeptidase/D-alanyl-D-alanine-endopeptidase (penicillin-binding protein 4)
VSERDGTRRHLARHVVAIVLAACALATAGVAWEPAGASRPAISETAALSTPLWSPRRLPQPLDAAVADTVDRRTLQAAMDQYVGRFEQSCYVVTSGDTVVASHDPDAGLLPASTLKTFTGLAALRVLGPDRRFTTTAVARTPGPDGSVPTIWMIGGGDPELADGAWAEPGVTTPLESLADAIVAGGIRRITGGIAFDDSRYDDQRFIPTWNDTYRTQFESGPIGALSVNHGIPLVNGKPVTVPDPGQYAATELATLLRARGVGVGPATSRATAPADAQPVGSVTSQPLRTIVAAMFRVSDNFVAEMLTKELDVHSGGAGTTNGGTAVTLDVLRSFGVPTAGIVMHDGSGLDRGDRATCRALASVATLAREQAVDGLAAALPRAADGTPIAGKVVAKGGYLEEVIGLAGLIDVNRPLQFAFLANGGLSAHPSDDIVGFAVTLGAVPTTDESALVPSPLSPARGEPRAGSSRAS